LTQYPPNKMSPALYGREVNQAWVVVRRSAWILLLLLVSNLLAACGGGGGGDISPATVALPATGLACAGDTNTSGASATLGWDTVTAASGYRLYYGTAPGTYEQLAGQGLDVADCTTYTVTGLGSGTVYYFAVTAYNGVAESSYSNEVSKQMP